MQRPWTVTLAWAAAITLVACSPRVVPPTPADPTQVSASTPLAGTVWVLSALTGSELLPHRSLTLEFGDDGGFSGSDGCNRYHGKYGSDGASLHFAKPVAATRLACPHAASMQAQAYFAALDRVSDFRQEPHQLLLLDGMGRTVATYASQQTTLAGSAWRVTGYHDGKQANQGLRSVLAGTEITAHFGNNGRLWGSGGCNTYIADYDAEAPGISVGLPRMTRQSCADPAGVMEQERQYAIALQTAINYRFSGDALEMRDQDGGLVLTLTRHAPE